MGDFNADPDKLAHLIALNKQIHWKYKLLQHLHDLNFIDSYFIFHDDQGGTWSNKYTSKCLDQIWLSPDLHLELLYCNASSTIIYQTDHRILATYFLTDSIFHRSQSAQTRRHNN